MVRAPDFHRPPLFVTRHTQRPPRNRSAASPVASCGGDIESRWMIFHFTGKVKKTSGIMLEKVQINSIKKL